VTPHESPEDRLRLLELVPSLLKSLRDGLASAAIDPFVTSEFFSKLEAVHVQVFQRFKREPEPQVEPALLVEGAEALAEAPLELGDAPLLELPAQEPEEAPAMVEVVEEIVLLAPGENRVQEPEVSLPDDDEALQQVDGLRVGSWVEIQEDEEHKLRAKLAAVIKPT